MPEQPPLVTIVVVSYNTRDLTLECLRSVQRHTRTPHKLVVFDNDSTDGSADAVEAEFPEIELIRSEENIGFARANNIVGRSADTEWLLLLNPDTEVFEGSLDTLIEFGHEHPEAGIYGGRTLFPDGSLNIASCWNAITPWSAVCMAFGLTAAFPRTKLFDPEAIGSWRRDTVRRVDIVVGCLFLIRSQDWRDLNGFDAKYLMYGEEADLCLRAEASGFRPMITPNAEIIHLVGASSRVRTDKRLMVAKARCTLIRDHWPARIRWFGLSMMYLWALNRFLASRLTPGRDRDTDWGRVWKLRRDWLGGYRRESK